MEKKTVSGIMLTLLLMGMFIMALGTVSVEANSVIIQDVGDSTANLSAVRASQGYLTRRNDAHAVDLKDNGWASIRYWSRAVNDYISSGSLDERKGIDVAQSHLFAGYKWDFESPLEWRDFAYVDDDSAELVIGLSDMRPNSYSELVDLIVSNGGELVNTVSMDGEISAVVADIPHVAMSTLVSEVEIVGLSKYIEPNVRFEIDFVPNDPDWPKQWGPRIIEADYAWNTTMGDPSVLVAVIDTGIDWDHPDLAANYIPSGYDWVNNDPDPMDDHGHGTHCAGIIAAVINNNIGIAGLAQVRIMAEKGLGPGGGWSDDLAKAIVHAVDQGADILSNSWGSYAKSMVVHEAMKYAYHHGVLVIGAAGNDATDIKHYPAAYDEVVAVTATDQYDDPASFTNLGDWVEVAAPGVHIYSTVWDDSYVYMSGTSMSAPHVSGVAALIWSQLPSLTRDQVRAQLRYSADDLGDAGFDVYYGYGRVNARRAVEQAPPDHDVLVLSLKRPRYVNLGSQVTINSTILNMGTSDESGITVQLLVNGSVVDSKIVSSLVSGASASVSCLWVPTVEGVYNVTSYILPVLGETITENNALSACIMVRIPEVIMVPDDYETIQSAIDAAIDGDTIFVASGTYVENVWINKENLTLVGEDRSNTIIDGGGRYDVVIVTADNVKIDGFTIKNSGKQLAYLYSGIFILSSNSITISNTTTLNNLIGICIFFSSGIILRDNNMTGNVYSFGVEGYSVTDFIHDIDTSNMVDGKPIYYWVNQRNSQFPADAGYVAAVNSSNITVKDLDLTNNYQGVLFAYSTNSIIENVNAFCNYMGIHLTYSCPNIVIDNNAIHNQVGVYLQDSGGNNISRNTITDDLEGISLYYSLNNTISYNNVSNNSLGLFLEKSNNNTVFSNKASNNTYGIYVQRSSYNVLTNNNMTINKYNFGVVGGHLVHFMHDIDTSNTVDGKPIHYLVNRKDLVIDPSTFPNLGYLGIVNSTNINVNNLTVTNNVQGILFAYTNGSIIGNINATTNLWGILMIKSFLNIVSGNTLVANQYNMDLLYSRNNTIYGNTITKGSDGIYLLYSSSNNIVDNVITWGWRGVWLGLNSGGNSITNTTISNNTCGIELYYSGGNTLRDNTMIANSYNFGIDGYFLSDFIEDVDTSNTVDGKPIYYWVNQHDGQVPLDAGYVALVNCTNITAKDLNLQNNIQGILLAYATRCIVSNVTSLNNYWAGIRLIESKENSIIDNMLNNRGDILLDYSSNENSIIGNTLSENVIGIYLYYSHDNIVTNNIVTGGTAPNGLVGICLTGSIGNIISRNVVAHNTFFVGAGIHLEWSSNNNTIIQNNITNNYYGISIGYWGDQNNNNMIYHNNIIENAEQVLSLCSINTWDDGYPSGGNHWSDYTGDDLYTGLYQNMTGNDGIGDRPYIIDENNKDRYPLMRPWKPPIPGDINKDYKVDMRDIVLAARAFGSYPGHPRWSPIADINKDNKIDMRDICLIARNFGKIDL